VIGRLLGAVALVGLGLLIGLVGAFVQAARWIVDTPWGTVSIPWGVALVWITLLVAIRAGAWLILTRWGCWAVLLGWLVATIALSAESPSGDLALSSGGRQMTYLLGGVILGSAAATLPLPTGFRRRRSGSRVLGTPEASQGEAGPYDPHST
jgi:hypothetical protein